MDSRSPASGAMPLYGNRHPSSPTVISALTGPAALLMSSGRETSAPATAHSVANRKYPGMNQSSTSRPTSAASAGTAIRSRQSAATNPDTTSTRICTNTTTPRPSTFPASSWEARTLASSTSTTRLFFSSCTPCAMVWPKANISMNIDKMPISAITIRCTARLASGSSARSRGSPLASTSAIAAGSRPRAASAARVLAVPAATRSASPSAGGSRSR
ncbi:hypothetical protein GCM10023321_77350 [Pseudonocardia eucalypti]|uniref:Uncharacterized protein n=1 Tax=Pseudonocardia eucalypti TaxID=648755 RepID=A0ABP9RBJ4_9PSEU|nr:hypothetical protein [Pseudonocardia eucalypti]